MWLASSRGHWWGSRWMRFWGYLRMQRDVQALHGHACVLWVPVPVLPQNCPTKAWRRKGSGDSSSTISQRGRMSAGQPWTASARHQREGRPSATGAQHTTHSVRLDTQPSRLALFRVHCPLLTAPSAHRGTAHYSTHCPPQHSTHCPTQHSTHCPTKHRPKGRTLLHKLPHTTPHHTTP